MGADMDLSGDLHTFISTHELVLSSIGWGSQSMASASKLPHCSQN